MGLILQAELSPLSFVFSFGNDDDAASPTAEPLARARNCRWPTRRRRRLADVRAMEWSRSTTHSSRALGCAILAACSGPMKPPRSARIRASRVRSGEAVRGLAYAATCASRFSSTRRSSSTDSSTPASGLCAGSSCSMLSTPSYPAPSSAAMNLSHQGSACPRPSVM